MLRLYHIKWSDLALRNLLLCCLTALAILTYTQMPVQECDGYEAHLHTNGKLYIHHHQPSHHGTDESQEDATDALNFSETDNSSSSGFSREKAVDFLEYNFCFLSLFGSHNSFESSVAEAKKIDYPPDKYFITYCSFLI